MTNVSECENNSEFIAQNSDSSFNEKSSSNAELEKV